MLSLLNELKKYNIKDIEFIILKYIINNLD